MYCDTWVCTKKGISYLGMFMMPYSSLCWYHPSSWERESDEAWNIPPLDASDYRDNVPWSIIFFAHKRKSKLKPFHFLFKLKWICINYIMCQPWSNVESDTLSSIACKSRTRGMKSICLTPPKCATLCQKELPPHNGRTVAPEAILFESPCRAHSETKIAQIICQGRDFNHLFYYS